MSSPTEKRPTTPANGDTGPAETKATPPPGPSAGQWPGGQSTLYTPQDIAAIKAQRPQPGRRTAMHALQDRRGAEHAVLWLKQRAEEIEAVPTGAASVIPTTEQDTK